MDQAGQSDRQSFNSGKLGILGGLGPLASAEFLKTIYEYNLVDYEQQAPVVFVYSDPSFPDRTEAFLSNNEKVIYDRLLSALRHLKRLGASRIVMCCLTMHHLLPQIPAKLRASIVSLVDEIVRSLANSSQTHLMFCSAGTRRLEIFQRHPKWKSVAEKVVFPGEKDQESIHHDLIYRIKLDRHPAEFAVRIEELTKKYGTTSFIAGCTEMHLQVKYLMRRADHRIGWIDPLINIAAALKQGEARVDRGTE